MSIPATIGVFGPKRAIARGATTFARVNGGLPPRTTATATRTTTLKYRGHRSGRQR
jgi:hypothetical protein